jgi:PKD domain
MPAEKSSTVLKLMTSTLLILGLLGTSPAYASNVFVSAGGPYEGAVGKEIEFDASGSYMLDDSEIDGYYWDWHGDGHFECFTTPTATHTWHSAFSGLVRVYVFYDHGVDPNGANTARVDWADTSVMITGPETALTLTLNSSAELHVRDECGRCIGTDPFTGLFDMEIEGATIEFVPPETGGAAEMGEIAEVDWATQYTIPLCTGSTYDITLTGLETGPFELCVQGLEDGKCVHDQTFKGIINATEEINLEVSACCQDGGLSISCSGLLYCPGLEVAPDEIALAVQPGGRYETTITVSETEGFRSLCGIALTCSDLTGEVYTIGATDVHFDRNGFDVAPGAKEEVTMTVEMPSSFVGQVAGAVTVACAGGQSETIDVALHKAGAHAPILTVGGPYSGVAGSPVTFDATGSYDPDGSIESYCWDWDLTGQYECVDDPVCEHTWDRAYAGVVRLRAVDNEGNATEQYVQVTIAASD